MARPARRGTLAPGRHVGLHAVVAASLLCVACGSSEPSGSAPASAPIAPAPTKAVAAAAIGPEATAQASEIFTMRCTPCHGAQGKGDGAASAGLVPPPRDFQDPTWQDGVTDEHIEKIVMYGGAAVGKAPMMPGNPDLTAKPDVVKALRAHVRSLRAAGP